MIPIFRAKKFNSDDWVQGYYYSATTNYHYITSGKSNITGEWTSTGYDLLKDRIDPDTLGIHFPNMLDEDNNKIFASLNKTAIGGDILVNGDFRTIAFYDEETSSIYLKEYGSHIAAWEYKHFKIVGINEREIHEYND